MTIVIGSNGSTVNAQRETTENISLGMRRYKMGEYFIIISQDMGRWHLSISHAKKYPTWRAIKEARYKYLPKDIYVAMILPPPEEYVNVHPNCFQLWEVKDSLAEQIWKG